MNIQKTDLAITLRLMLSSSVLAANDSNIHQHGTANYADVLQTASNASNIKQRGETNQASVLQTASHNHSTINQIGSSISNLIKNHRIVLSSLVIGKGLYAMFTGFCERYHFIVC